MTIYLYASTFMFFALFLMWTHKTALNFWIRANLLALTIFGSVVIYQQL